MNRIGFFAPRTSRRAVLLVCAAATLAAAGCSDDTTGPLPGPSLTGLTGTVTTAATGEPVAGADVTFGTRVVTTGADGRFVFADVTPGSAVIACAVTGYEDYEAEITIPAEGIDHDIALARIELFEFGDHAVYVPATVSTVRGILLTLGGPDTRGFASDANFGAPVPETEAALHDLGERFRTLAATHGLAVMGTSLSALADEVASDEILRHAIGQAAAVSGRPELDGTPILVYGISGGGPEASGFATRNAEGVIGLFLRVPQSFASVTAGPALGIPTYVLLAELDTFVDNAALEAAFLGNRAAGALWALALERNVIHFALTPAQRALSIDWMRSVLDRRLGAPGSGGLVSIGESSGWLGDSSTGAVAPWAAFAGDRASASWFPSAATGTGWAEFIGAAPAAVPLLIRASLGPQAQSIFVHRAEVAVSEAVVTVNGVRVPYVTSGNYMTEFPTPVAGGMRLDLEVHLVGDTVRAVGFVPEAPVIVAPAEGAVYGVSDTVSLSWMTAADPAWFAVGAYNFPEDWFTDGWANSWSASGAERELTVTAAGIAAPEPIELSVIAIGEGSFADQVEPGSFVTVVSEPGVVGITLVDDGDVYDLAASIESFDPAWGDLSGYRYAGLLRLELDPAGTPGIGGSFSQLRVIDPDGGFTSTGGDGSGAGAISSYLSPVDGTLVVELAGDQFHLDLFPEGIDPASDTLPATVEGTFFTGGHIGGTFTAVRRPAN